MFQMNFYKIHNLFIIILLVFFGSCKKGFYRTQNPANIATVNNNVCKKLTDKVVLYAIFVDSRTARPWSKYDITSTLDSIKKAMNWIEVQARENNIQLEIYQEHHQNGERITIERNLPEETLSESLFSPNIMEGMENLDFWADAIARKAGESFSPDTLNNYSVRNKMTDRERLIARLRDIHKTDNVVIMYFLNSYYQNDISLALHTSSSKQTEYSIVTFKNPSVIAHEFLHIFGALDLYMSPFDRKKKALRSKYEIMKLYPNEIMAFAHRPIEKLSISNFTKYLVGWVPELDENSKNAFFGKKLKVVKY